MDGGLAHIQGKNFAPVEPLAMLRDRSGKSSNRRNADNPSSLHAFLREQAEEIAREYEDEWRDQIEQARVIQMLRAGKLVMKRDMGNSGYVFLRRIHGQGSSMNRSNYPIFPSNSEALKAKWLKSNPAIKAANFGDGYRTQIALDDINTVIKYYFKKIIKPRHIDEALSAQDYGTYIWQFYYDDRIDQIRQSIPVIRNEDRVLMDGYGACYECGFEGKPPDFAKGNPAMPQCPDCGSYKTTKMVDEVVGQVPSIVGVDEVVQGDISGRLINFASCRYDPHKTPEDSGYFMYSEALPLRMMRALLGGEVDISEGVSDDYGLQVLDALAARGGTSANIGEDIHYGRSGLLANSVTVRTVWLKPERYMGFKTREAERTINGTIPADTPYEQIFPKGLVFVSIDDNSIIPFVGAEEANIASGRYLTLSHTGIGKGIDDGVDLARDLNEIHSMAMAGLKRYGASGLVIKANAGITQENVRDMFKPQKAVFVDMEEAGIDDIRKVVTQFQPNPVNQVLPQYAIAMTNMFNLAMMNADFTQGLVQDVDIDTLGGQQLAHAKTEEQRGGVLTGKVMQREQAAKIIFNLFRQHIRIPKWYANDNDRQGVTRGKYLSGFDMPTCDLMFEAVPESEIPVNSYEKQVAARELVEKAGGIGAIAEAMTMNPQLLGWYADQFGVDVPMLDEKELQMVCLARVDNIKELANVFQSPEEILGDPMIGYPCQLTKPLAVREQQNVLKAQFLQTILDDDEVTSWGPLVRATIELLIERHYEQAGEEEARNQIIAATAQMKAQVAMQQMQQAAMQPMVASQRAQQQEDAAMQFGAEMVGKMVDDEAAQLQHERDMEKQQAADESAESRAIAADQRAESRAANADARQLDMRREEASFAKGNAGR